jgi:2-oxoglutarate dehydrogenase E2 component (dihydrolipoamide succinyltransferase)
MAIVDLVMPKMGESIMEATVLKWYKNPGDTIKMDETLLDIATDKVDSEVPSTVAGVIKELLYKVNDVVPVGAVIARIDPDGAAHAVVPAKETAHAPHASHVAHAVHAAPVSHASHAAAVPQPQPQAIAHPAEPHAPSVSGSNGARFYSPLVLNIAGQEGIGMAELEKIPGTGNEGRVTKKDILNYVANKDHSAVLPATPAEVIPVPVPVEEVPLPVAPQPVAPVYTAPQPAAPVTMAQQPSAAVSGNVEIVEMDRMRKLIAEHMVRSKATSPHVTSFTEADVTNIVKWREKAKIPFEQKYGEKITYTPIFFEAIVNCIRRYPLINCSLDGTRIIIKKDINIGMAAALPSGNLIVPVIRNADTKNLLGLTKDVNALANAARNSKLKADDTQGGTFTVTNVGTFGSLMGTPIINQPQVAILALGVIKKRPMVMETELGDVIAIRHMMYLSLSYDHRIVDGSLGASFLTAVANELEAFDLNRPI